MFEVKKEKSTRQVVWGQTGTVMSLNHCNIEASRLYPVDHDDDDSVILCCCNNLCEYIDDASMKIRKSLAKNV